MQSTALLLGLSALLASPVLSAAAFVGTGDCGVREPYSIHACVFITQLCEFIVAACIIMYIYFCIG